jgi:hypothetical protein
VDACWCDFIGVIGAAFMRGLSPLIRGLYSGPFYGPLHANSALTLEVQGATVPSERRSRFFSSEGVRTQRIQARKQASKSDRSNGDFVERESIRAEWRGSG